MDSFTSEIDHMATMNWDGQVKHAEGIAGDRRTDRRYDIHLDLRWKLIRRRRILETGTGATIDFSSGGILFETERALPVGLNVELSVAWPVLLHNVAQLQLVVSGRIVRSQGGRAAIQMTAHEFRTVGVPADRRNAASGAPHPPFTYFSRQSAAPGLR